MARFLLAPHAPTGSLAHVGACLAVGCELRARGHQVEMAYGGNRPEVIEREAIRWHPVPEVAPRREWDPAGWFGSTSELSAMVAAHRSLIARLRIDTAVTSSGVAARLACEMEGVPEVHLNHYLATSRYGRAPLLWDNRRRDLRRPRRAVRVARSRLRRSIRLTRRSSTPRVVAQVRAQLGLPPASSTSAVGNHASIVALTTAPFLDPAHDLPEHWRYIGPVLWSAPPVDEVAPPARGQRPLVYVTQGSTGDPELLRRAVGELAGEPVDVLVTTGGLCEPAELERLGTNVRAAGLLPGRACLQAADAAIVHGGHITFCETLRAGTPMVVLPYRQDQIARVNRVERLGAGVGLWPRPRRRGRIAAAVRRLLDDPSYRERSKALAVALDEDWDGARNAADQAESLAR